MNVGGLHIWLFFLSHSAERRLAVVKPLPVQSRRNCFLKITFLIWQRGTERKTRKITRLHE